MMATTTLTDEDLKNMVELKTGKKIRFSNKLINDENELEIWWY